MADQTAGAPPHRATVPTSRRWAGGPASLLAAPSEKTTAAFLLIVFLVSLLIPYHFQVAGLRLSPTRVFLLVAFVPLLLRLVSGRAGRITAADTLIGLHCLWLGIALVVVHGAERFAFAGITIAELFGGYLIGRTLVRSAADHVAVFRYLTIAFLILLPFALMEMATSQPPLINALGAFTNVLHAPRSGFYRAQVVFEHPILFGLFCSVAIANLFYIYRPQIVKSTILSGLAVFMTFASLSSAPLLSALTQFFLTAWDHITRGAWWILVVLAAIVYVLVDALSNRTPVTILISDFTFSAESAWYRILIWDYGTAEVQRNPIFGIGLNDWIRADWMYHPTIDNFWLVVAMRYGMPGFLLLLYGIAYHLYRVLSAPDLSENERRYRLGYVIASVGLFLTLSTVHIWGAVSVFVMFYIGMGSWFFTSPRQPSAPVETTAPSRRDGATRRLAPPTSRPGPAAEVAAAPSSRPPSAAGAIQQRPTLSRGPAGAASDPATEPAAGPATGAAATSAVPAATGAGVARDNREATLRRRRAQYGGQRERTSSISHPWRGR